MVKKSSPKNEPAPQNNELSKAKFEAAIMIVKSIAEIAKTCTFCYRINTVLAACEKDHEMKIERVDSLISILREFRSEMSQEVKDQYFLNMLKLLDTSESFIPLYAKLETSR